MQNNKNNELVCDRFNTSSEAYYEGEIKGNGPLICFCHKPLKVSWRKKISYQVWTECQDRVPQTLGGLKRSRILFRINLQDLMPLLAFRAHQQWPLDLGHEKKTQQPCVPFQAYCITAVGNCNCGVWLRWTWPSGRSQKHFSCGYMQALRVESLWESIWGMCWWTGTLATQGGHPPWKRRALTHSSQGLAYISTKRQCSSGYLFNFHERLFLHDFLTQLQHQSEWTDLMGLRS